MNSYVMRVLALYEGIISDITAHMPNIRRSMDMDLSYLRRASKDRGIEFFTLTLPAYGEWFDQSLAHKSLLSKDKIPRGIRLRGGRPQLFEGILAKIFGYDGVLKADADVTAVLYFRTLVQSLKKFEYGVSRSTRRKSVKDFIDVDSRLPRSHQDTWDSDIPSWKERSGHPLWGGPCNSSDPYHGDLFACDSDHWRTINIWGSLRELSRRITSSIGVCDVWGLQPKHGPGVVSERLVGTKYDFPSWPRKLQSMFPYDWFGSSSLDGPYPDETETLGRLIAVPKTRKSPRLICAEPVAHQYIQQGILGFLNRAIRKTVLRHSIDLMDQTKSQQAALRASASGDYATLDLSAASDRLSTRLVEYLFQGSTLLDLFHASRTRAIKQTLESDMDHVILLRKFSTMGSALTFPVQSIVFTLLSVWAVKLYRGTEWNFDHLDDDFRAVRVFGDDIIVPTDASRLVTLVLHQCGLLVNTAKSFTTGNFRESCGCDAFKGVDVTPPRHRKPYNASAESTAALIQYANNLFIKGFWRASEVVLGWLPPQERKLLMVVHPDFAGCGLVSFCGEDVSHLKEGYDSDLHRRYIVRLSFFAKVGRTDDHTQGRLLQFFIEDPASRDLLEREVPWLPGRPIVGRLRKSRTRDYR